MLIRGDRTQNWHAQTAPNGTSECVLPTSPADPHQQAPSEPLPAGYAVMCALLGPSVRGS